MREQLSRSARLMGIVLAGLILSVGLAYGITLGLGLASLSSPDQPTGGPYFLVMEALILMLAPAMVALMVAVHAWAPQRYRALSLTAVCFMVSRTSKSL